MTKPSTTLLKPNKPKQSHKQKIARAEWKRLQVLKEFEAAARQEGYSIIAGIDEAGRGPLAGPVVAAACIIPEDLFIPGINDSKQLTPKVRRELFEALKSDSRIHYGVGIISHEEIDKINILQATKKAMLQAIDQLPSMPDYLLVDGLQLQHPNIPSKKIVQGDCKSYLIAAASIIAKETRDGLMHKYHEQWPEYGFNQHKGYGTPEHLDAIVRLGPCPIHRLSFEPLKGRSQEPGVRSQEESADSLGVL